MPNEKTTMRLQVYLAHQGVSSRRKAFELIRQGHVSVNGAIVDEPSFSVTPFEDKVQVNGRTIQVQPYVYVLLNKPAGYTTTRQDPFAEKVVLELLPRSLAHLHPVGRLDKDTEGLLLLTNDGEITQKLIHPKFNIDKTYQVGIDGELDTAQVTRLERGIILDGKKTWPAKISHVQKHKGRTAFLITIHEGRKRQIRRMLQEVGRRVVFLKRLTQGPLELGKLKTGEHRFLSAEEINALKKMQGESG